VLKANPFAVNVSDVHFIEGLLLFFFPALQITKKQAKFLEKDSINDFCHFILLHALSKVKEDNEL